MKVITHSGTVYTFRKNDDGDLCIHRERTFPFGAMRRDEEWLCGDIENLPVEIGKPLMLVLEPLGDGPFTWRSTTAVIEIEDPYPDLVAWVSG